MNIGFPEMLVLAFLALLIFGPNRLPEIARSVGKALRAFQNETSRAMDELRSATEGLGVVDSADERPPSAAPSPAPVTPAVAAAEIDGDAAAPAASDVAAPEPSSNGVRPSLPGPVFEDT